MIHAMACYGSTTTSTGSKRLTTTLTEIYMEILLVVFFSERYDIIHGPGNSFNPTRVMILMK